MTWFKVTVNKEWEMNVDKPEQAREEILDHIRREGIVRDDIQVKEIEED